MIRHSKLAIGAAMMALAGIGMIVDAIIPFVTNFALEVGIRPEQVILSSVKAALGFVLAALAWYGIRRGQMWTWITAIATFLLVAVAAFPIRYLYNLGTSDHFGFSYMGASMFVMGAFMTLWGLRNQRSCCLPNEAAEASKQALSRSEGRISVSLRS